MSQVSAVCWLKERKYVFCWRMNAIIRPLCLSLIYNGWYLWTTNRTTNLSRLTVTIILYFGPYCYNLQFFKSVIYYVWTYEPITIGLVLLQWMVHSDDVIGVGAVGWQWGSLQWAPGTLLLLPGTRSPTYAEIWFIQTVRPNGSDKQHVKCMCVYNMFLSVPKPLCLLAQCAFMCAAYLCLYPVCAHVCLSLTVLVVVSAQWKWM